MPDVVVTLPKSFRYGGNPSGLASWLAEGCGPGDAADGYYSYTVSSRPNISAGERVYVVYDGQLIGYAPLVCCLPPGGRQDLGHGQALINQGSRFMLIRAGGAVAVTIARRIPGFRGFRYRWWSLWEEHPFDFKALAAESQGKAVACG